MADVPSVLTDFPNTETVVQDGFDRQKLGVLVRLAKTDGLSNQTQNLFENNLQAATFQPKPGDVEILKTDPYPKTEAAAVYVEGQSKNVDSRLSISELSPLLSDLSKVGFSVRSRVRDKEIMLSNADYTDEFVAVLKDYPKVGIEIKLSNDSRNPLGSPKNPPSVSEILNAPGGKVFSLYLRELR